MADVYYLLFIFNKYLGLIVNIYLALFSEVLTWKSSLDAQTVLWGRWGRRVYLYYIKKLKKLKQTGRWIPGWPSPGGGGVWSSSKAVSFQNQLSCPGSQVRAAWQRRARCGQALFTSETSTTTLQLPGAQKGKGRLSLQEEAKIWALTSLLGRAREWWDPNQDPGPCVHPELISVLTHHIEAFLVVKIKPNGGGWGPVQGHSG